MIFEPCARDPLWSSRREGSRWVDSSCRWTCPERWNATARTSSSCLCTERASGEDVKMQAEDSKRHVAATVTMRRVHNPASIFEGCPWVGRLHKRSGSCSAFTSDLVTEGTQKINFDLPSSEFPNYNIIIMIIIYIKIMRWIIISHDFIH